jgi:hypothetical protein
LNATDKVILSSGYIGEGKVDPEAKAYDGAEIGNREPQTRLLCNYIEKICLQFIPRINVVGFLADLKGD